MSSIHLCLWLLGYVSFWQCIVVCGALSLRERVSFSFDENSDPVEVVKRGCEGTVPSCERLARPQVEIAMHRQYGVPMQGWTVCTECGADMPHQEPLDFIQHIHIPKTGGTALNSFLLEYMGCHVPVNSFPCEESVVEIDPHNVEGSLLCQGRLLACAGHRVAAETPQILLSEPSYAVLMMRHPWYRLQSDYHYVRSKPHSAHLAPETNATALLRLAEEMDGLYTYTTHRNISNCMTKMLNGYQCGEDISELLASGKGEDMLVIAKQALLSLLFVGLQEHFMESVCLFAWMYGSGRGNYPSFAEGHFVRVRAGTYESVRYPGDPVYGNTNHMGPMLHGEMLERFQESEWMDLELYEFARSLFLERMNYTTLRIMS